MEELGAVAHLALPQQLVEKLIELLLGQGSRQSRSQNEWLLDPGDGSGESSNGEASLMEWSLRQRGWSNLGRIAPLAR